MATSQYLGLAHRGVGERYEMSPERPMGRSGVSVPAFALAVYFVSARRVCCRAPEGPIDPIEAASDLRRLSPGIGGVCAESSSSSDPLGIAGLGVLRHTRREQCFGG
jgi:hypothetical protein